MVDGVDSRWADCCKYKETQSGKESLQRMPAAPGTKAAGDQSDHAACDHGGIENRFKIMSLGDRRPRDQRERE